MTKPWQQALLDAWQLHTPEPASFTDIAFETGRIAERTFMLGTLKRRVCFDHLANKVCDHQACYAVLDLIALLEART